ncbi:LAMI_0B06458g1_1 [Lachancea mirantina]|uniref:2'-phosphotransferase n=1 Tax=Lachancea mirantina TaxID=1230905 RepID=A0A1G4IWJ4_9SACH|nr:LAMI_0B06458g1_1 [Lachancea mirantina]
MNSDRRDTQISKSLAYLLRHGAIKEGLPIDVDGYVPIDVLLAHNRLKSQNATKLDVDRVVATNSKKRFHVKTVNNVGLICATQGHSIEQIVPTKSVLVPITDPQELPEKLIHGTNVANCLVILETGYIKKMRRNHVHLAPGVTGIDDNVVSGMRNSSNVHIYLQRDTILEKATLFKSLNDVYLSVTDIPISLIEKVTIKAKRGGDKDSKAPKKVQELTTLLEKMHIPYKMI